jgi:N-acetyl-anhydromuramyl-L-alanine amidase AmpD
MTMRYPGNSSFIKAKNYTHVAGANLPVTRIVIHDMEWPEKSDTAEGCANMFATTTRKASVHYCVDNNSVVQDLDLDYIAWHAPPNTGSVGIEHAGYANQTRTQWLDPYGKSMLEISAKLTAWLCAYLDIPARWLTVAQLRAGYKGLCTHADVSNAWHETDHTDPGPNFPKDYYLARVKAYLSGKGTDMPITSEDATVILSAFLNYVPEGQTLNLKTLWKRAYEQTDYNTQVLAGINGVLAQIQASEQTGGVDVTALAQALAAQIPASLNVDVSALASAVSDEIHNRMAG